MSETPRNSIKYYDFENSSEHSREVTKTTTHTDTHTHTQIVRYLFFSTIMTPMEILIFPVQIIRRGVERDRVSVWLRTSVGTS